MTKRWPLIVAVSAAILIAFHTGFRIPNRWAVTHHALSLFDGFYRRWVVGSVLRPIALATDFNYWTFATFSFLMIAGVLAVLVINLLRAKLLSQQLLIIAWILLPTGGFLFDEVGYFEQPSYLLLFASMWLLRRDHPIIATCVIAITPCIHEIALLSCIPMFGVVALRTLPLRRAVVFTAIPIAINIIVLVLPGASADAATNVSGHLAHANFTYHADTFYIFNRSLAEARTLFPVGEVVRVVMPVAAFLVGMYIALYFTDRELAPNLIVLLASCAAIAAPAALSFVGFDFNRWQFLIISNFFIVLWLGLDGTKRELAKPSIFVALVALLVLANARIGYFDSYYPRDLGYQPIRRLLVDMNGKGLLAIPKK